MSRRMLYDACVGDNAGVLAALEKGADINTRDDDGSTALIVAARNRNTELGLALLAYAPDLEIRGPQARTALSWALIEGNLPLAEALFQAGANPHAIGGYGLTTLHLAVGSRNREVIAAVLDRGVGIDIVDSTEDTPLTLAAACGMYDIVFLLADRGADINRRGNGGKTALMRFISDLERENRRRAEAAKAEPQFSEETGAGAAPALTNEQVLAGLLQRGADISLGDNRDMTPLMAAAEDGLESLCSLLLGYDADLHARDSQGRTAFDWAARGGQLNTMRLLLGRGAVVDSPDDFGVNALFREMRDANLKVVAFLLENGANPNTTDGRGDTALLAAVKAHNLDAVDILLSHGANIDMLNARGETALDHALENHIDEFAHALFLRGAHTTRTVADLLNLGEGGLNGLDEDGWTPLINAVRSADLARVQVLLDAGARVDRRSDYGVTPLMFAAKTSGDGILELLLANGADANARDKGGESVLHYAINGQRVDHVALLLAAGADAQAKDNNGVTPIKLARDYNMSDILALLLESVPEPEWQPEDPRSEDAEGGQGTGDDVHGKRKKDKKKKHKKDRGRAAWTGEQAGSVLHKEVPYSPHEMVLLDVTPAVVSCLVTGPEMLGHRWSHDEALEGEADATIVRHFGQNVLDEVYAAIYQLRFPVTLASAPGAVPGSPDPVVMDVTITMNIQESSPETGATDADSTGAEDADATRMLVRSLAGKTFVFTGTLVRFTRAEAEAKVARKGGKVGATVTKLTSYMVAGEKAGSKLARAAELGVPVITEEEFLAMVEACG